MKQVYCVYDRVAGVFYPPVTAENKEVAIRSFNNAMETNPFSKDMALYYLGTYNDDTDGVINSVKPEFVVNSPVKVGE